MLANPRSCSTDQDYRIGGRPRTPPPAAVLILDAAEGRPYLELECRTDPVSLHSGLSPLERMWQPVTRATSPVHRIVPYVVATGRGGRLDLDLNRTNTDSLISVYFPIAAEGRGAPPSPRPREIRYPRREDPQGQYSSNYTAPVSSSAHLVGPWPSASPVSSLPNPVAWRENRKRMPHLPHSGSMKAPGYPLLRPYSFRFGTR